MYSYHLAGINVFQEALPDANCLSFIYSKSSLKSRLATVSPGDFIDICTVEQAGSSDEGFAIYTVRQR